MNKYGIFETPVFGSKNPVFEAKTGVLGSKIGVSKYSKNMEYEEFVLFQIFQKLQENGVKIEFIFLLITRSNSNFNRNFDYEFGSQGLPFAHCVAL